MSEHKQITIEGYTEDELLGLSEEQIDAFILCNSPIIFKLGSAGILGQFKIDTDTLTVELAHIDGGGEGVLPTIWSLVERYATRKRLTKVEWIVHAVDCAKPNLKLRRILKMKGFKIEQIAGRGEAYRYIHEATKRAV